MTDRLYGFFHGFGGPFGAAGSGEKFNVARHPEALLGNESRHMETS